MNKTVGGGVEYSMDYMIVRAMVLVVLRWWTSVAPWRRAVAMQQQAGVDRSRIK